ncbi:fatty acid CoA ligase FadD36 [Micromonospora sp. Llam0]|uniref:acyl-CoA synthetase n=1 Tax=Micromonospora sp. Llam0 TaxID=2485143 RepID=UPI000F470FAF|nr:acyl-CoA synthetase [Micromonospora sp. Llam0]ROO52476.1 fatty acid CoA ligase FadD36 [Micromonospora sp. Llam0]
MALLSLTRLAGRSAAVTVGDQSMSGDDLLEAATAVAGQVAGAGTVAVDATASLDTVVALTGCLLAGTTLVPVPPDAGPVERGHILRDSGAQLLLGPDPTLPAGGGIDRGGPGQHPAVGPDTPALILYTSGTTGAPKGVPVTSANIAADLDALAEAWAWTPDDTLVHGLPLFHVHGLVLGVIGALRVGCRLVHTGRPTPEAYAAAGGTLYFGVPTIWSRICADRPSARALRAARLLVSGSAALPAPVFHTLAELTGQAPVERYGMTETLITVSSRADGERRPGWVGTPLAGVHTRLAGEAGEQLPADGETIGELQVRGPMVFDGYLGAAGRGDFTPDGWFRTGDVATIDQAGWHRIVGRASTDLIKSGGYRIGAGEVENVLLTHPAVREAAVVGAPDADLGQRVVAYVVAEGVSPQSLIDFVATELSAHKRPRDVRIVDALPRNAMGKVQKKLLHDDRR